MAVIHAIYASTSGNVEFVVDTVAEGWRQAGHQVELHRAEVTSADIITNNSLFLFATSTWDHGIMNPYFNALYDAMNSIDCTGKSAFFIGCGDFRYEPVMFNTGIQDIFNRWQAQGGSQLHQHLKLNGDPTLSVNNLIKPWITATTSLLETYDKR